VRKIRFNQK